MENKNIKPGEEVPGQGTAIVRQPETRLSLDPIMSLFDETWKLYQERFLLVIKIVLLPVLVTILGYTLSNLRLPLSSLLGGVVLFIGTLMSFFNVLPLIYSIDNETDIDDSYKATMQLVLPFAWLTVLEVLAVIGGFVMLIIPGIWLAFAFSLTSYVFVLEKRRGIAALRQSVDYIEGYWWAVLGRVLLMGIFVMLANAAVQWLTSSFSGRVGESIISLAFSLFTTPFTAIFFYVIYKNLKALKPELIEAESVAKGEIVKASVIVGVVALALVALIIIFLAWHGVARSLEFSQWMRHQ